MVEADAPALTRDAFYNGRLVLAQPVRGHRSGTDAVLLAAAVSPAFTGFCYDMGSGVGAVGLGIALLRPGTRVVLVERDAAAVALAWANATVLDLTPPVTVADCDILDKADLRRALPERADLVVTNPPFHDPRRSRPSPDPARRVAHVLGEGAGIGDWIEACLDRLADKGTLIVIHAATAVPDMLACLASRTGAVTVKPILPRAGEAAHRVLVRATKGSRAPFTLAAPLVLHDDANRFTQEAERLHRGEAALVW